MGTEGKVGYATSLAFLGDVALNCNETEKARSLYEESVVVLREPRIGDINFLGYPTRRLAQLAWREGDFENAISLCNESLRLNSEVGDRRAVICCVAGFAAIATAQRKFERATTLMSAVETQLASMGIRLIYMDNMEYKRNLDVLRAKLDQKTFIKSWAKGKALSLDEAIAFALEET
jgi:tetratricopeptide (TPR) repeat protein